ncbi:MAG: hypothetical protein QOE70_6688 [Chthoniobacter sp.]|nr:hypothetical protein [Chthoniobacter sp.]
MAIIGDLTTQGTVVVPTSYGNAIFSRDFTQPAGTGVFDPFLTIQANGVEQGYNTSAKKGVFDTKREPQWNHEFQVKDLRVQTIGGVQYFAFVIDINEPNGGAKSEISLDSIKIFTTRQIGQNTTDVESLGVKRFDLENNWIKYDDQNHGSGQADISFFVPIREFFDGPNPVKMDDYVYMYQRFGDHISADFDGTTQGGFEETAMGGGVAPVPEMATILPLAGVLGLGMFVQAYRRRSRKVDVGSLETPESL